MTITLWPALLALSALGLTASNTAAPRASASMPHRVTRGGPPDTLVASPRASSLRWRGTGLGGRGARSGTVALSSGMLVIRHEQLVSGTFAVDMRSLDVTLRGADLFDAARYPTAVFSATGAQRVGAARWRVSGNLTMHGATRPLRFDTDVRWEELGHMVATASLALDRRQWGVGGHGKLVDGIVDNAIQLSITLDARRKQAAVATR